MEDKLDKLRFYMKRELDKWDRVELETTTDEADFIAIDLVLEVLPKAVADYIEQEKQEAYKKGYTDGGIGEILRTEDAKKVVLDELAQTKKGISNE